MTHDPDNRARTPGVPPARPNRRDFLKSASAAMLAALSAGAPRAFGDEKKQEEPALPRHADSVILLWMGGAVGQTETFDPKTYTPFEVGLDPRKLLSTFKSIDTSVDNIKFCEGVENLAKVMDRGALVRSYVARDYGALAEDLQHIPFQYKWHTGYTTPSTVPAPYLGAWVSQILGPNNPDLPAFIEIGRSEKTTNVFLSLAAFNSAGFLGSVSTTASNASANWPRPAPSPNSVPATRKNRSNARSKTPTV
jgi:hypothetical protein